MSYSRFEVRIISHNLRASQACGVSFLPEPPAGRTQFTFGQLVHYPRHDLHNLLRHTATGATPVAAAALLAGCGKAEQLRCLYRIAGKSHDRSICDRSRLGQIRKEIAIPAFVHNPDDHAPAQSWLRAGTKDQILLQYRPLSG